MKGRLNAARVGLELVSPTGARFDVEFVHTFAQGEDAAVYEATEVGGSLASLRYCDARLFTLL